MIKSLSAIVCLAACATAAVADDYKEYPAPTSSYPFQRSFLTGKAVVVPPYRRAFPIRVYTTPPQQPYYNVPPYAVISPY